MPALKHLLVPTDGTALSDRAVRTAIALARASKGRITALHVIPAYIAPMYMDGLVPDPAFYSETEYRRATQAHARRMLDRVAKLAAAAKVPCETRILTASLAWKSIIQAAKSARCDAIVMASHGRKGVEALILGSETTKVLTHSRIPVLVCR